MKSLIALFSLPIVVFSQTIGLIQPNENSTLTPGAPFTVELGHNSYIQNIVYASTTGLLFKSGSEAEALYINSTQLDGATSGVTMGSGDEHFSTTYKFNFLMPPTTFGNDTTSATFTLHVVSFVGVGYELWDQIVNTTVKISQPSSVSSSESSSSPSTTPNSSFRERTLGTDFMNLLGLSLLISIIGGITFV